MLKVRTKTLSLLYYQREDRMKLIINKDEEERIEFWITRRFYFSLLFELEIFLEQLQIAPVKPIRNKQNTHKREVEKISPSTQKSKKEKLHIPLKKKENDVSTLLENVNIHFVKESENFIFLFQSNTVEAESIFKREQFLNFYSVLKSSFPKGEWGII